MAAFGCMQSQVLLSGCSRPQFVVLCQNSSCSPSSTSVFLVHMMNSSNSSFPLISSQGFPSSQWMSCCLCLPSSRNIMQVQTSPFANSLRCGQTRQHFARLAHVEKRWRSSCRSRDSQRSLRLIAKANDSTADDSLPSEMSLENALKLLGVREGASFDEILTAKKTMVDSCRGDQARITQVEAAYDMLLMQSLSLRQAGKVADNTIRYADVRKRKSPVSGSGPEWLRTALKNAPVAFETPSLSALGTQTGVFVALSIWMFASGLMSSPSESSLSGGADVSGVILAIGFGVSLYFLRKQNLKLGKAALITVAGLVVGAGLGGWVESWLRVDIVPVLGIGSPTVVVSEFVLFSLWASSLYLR
ncbi:hypothetical protein CY35_06G072900 [Sphagnum magellanicum]|nr:hypothetical protein CY35_06G072900 [Sphagnum magellanicum]KAH9559750.1 hypothetical protein CY35_06G072900 [Sphagnum magellanicum]